MGKPDPTPDPMQERLDRLFRKYKLVAAKIEPKQGEGSGGRSGIPTSRPPLQIDPVSEMSSFERSLAYHEARFDQILHRIKRIDITDRTGARCPHCGTGKLVGWVRDHDPEDHDHRFQPDEVICLNWEADIHALAAPEGGAPWRWTKDQWPRLGVSTGVREDHRYGPRLPGAATA